MFTFSINKNRWETMMNDEEMAWEELLVPDKTETIQNPEASINFRRL